MKYKIKAKSNNSYIEDLKKWQENQYNPGYFLGKKASTYDIRPGKPRALGWLNIALSIFLIIILIPILIKLISMGVFIVVILICFIYLLMVPFLFIGGIRLLRKKTKPKRYSKKK